MLLLPIRAILLLPLVFCFIGNSRQDEATVFREFCLGTENGRTVISVDKLNHYSRLWKSFVRCRRIIGNLEITHIDGADLLKAEKERQEELKNSTEKSAKGKNRSRPPERPFQFLEDLEEITGYLLIFNVNLTELSLPKLRVIWGEKLHDGNALQIDSNPRLHVLNLPSLRTIEEGLLTIRRTPNLCYMFWKGKDYNYNTDSVDYREIMNPDELDRRLNIPTHPVRNCRAKLPCHDDCDGNCFGPGKEMCQTIYRKNCQQPCESKACFFDAGSKISRCCDDACAGGCFGEGRDKCVACKKFEQDGICVTECRGTHEYNHNRLERQELEEKDRRYAYGRHCVPKCPPGTLVEDEHCVSRCSVGRYRDAQIDDGRCVPCPEGRCPRVCQLTEALNAVNIKRLENCSEIEGNIELLGHAFQEHIPPGITPVVGSMPAIIPALNASQLDVLKSVRIVTGFVVVDGSKKASKLKPKSLGFLENLEVIEGRKLYYEKYALYIIGNPDLKWLGLRSLKKIKNGLISIQRNERLCYSYTIPFEEVFSVRQSLWDETNMARDKCEKIGRKCNPNCDARRGCWGPGTGQCVKCRNFNREGECTEDCPKFGYYVPDPEQSPSQCIRCYEQCRLCHGPQATDCSECVNSELWIDEKEQAIGTPTIERIMTPYTEGAVRKCVAKCPNETFESVDGSSNRRQCIPCHPHCVDGCTGPGTHLGQGGCSKCNIGVNQDGVLKCLQGEEPVNPVCKNGIGDGYFISLEPSSTLSKFLCRQCRPECATCTQEGIARDICECAYWNVLPSEGNGDGKCALDCGVKGTRILAPRNDTESSTNAEGNVGLCQECHPFCDPNYSCTGNGQEECDRCANGGVHNENGTVQCLADCPPEAPYVDEEGMCQAVDKERMLLQKKLMISLALLVAFILIATLISFLVYRCLIYQKRYIKEVQMHLPEIPALDPMKVTQRPNMRRLNLIQINELDFLPNRSTVLGQGAFGIVYAGKWHPPGYKVNIPVAIKAISQTDSRHLNEKEMLREAGLMHSVQHEHLLPVAGICLGDGAIKIVTLLRPLGNMLSFFERYGSKLGSKQLMLYCYQISSAMEYLAKKGIVHRDLAARNVLVKNAIHVEVTDFGLATMLQRPGDTVVVESRVAVKWLAPESLRRHIYNQWTDVWSFGVTCWEILTLGGSPYKELGLPREQLVRELADRLEGGYRLPCPPNCIFELYQELINCWMFNPESRRSFRDIKERFEQFCRAPHLYIRERQMAAHQRMESISSQEQQSMIARLLKDSDFVDPVSVDPADYATAAEIAAGAKKSNNKNNGNGSISSPDTVSTDCFFSSSNGGGSGKSRGSPTPKRIDGATGKRHGSTGTASSRYKSDPVGRKWSQPWSSSIEESVMGRGTFDEQNYLVPKRVLAKFIDEGDAGREEEEEDGEIGEMYTTVVDGKDKKEMSHGYTNQREYMNNQQKGDDDAIAIKGHDQEGEATTIEKCNGKSTPSIGKGGRGGGEGYVNSSNTTKITGNIGNGKLTVTNNNETETAI